MKGRHMAIEIMKPEEIEKRSFEIITELLGDKKLDPRHEKIIKRAIHTSADFDYADSLYFSEDVVDIIKDALKNGANVVTDTQMAMAGINKERLAQLGAQVHCFMSDEDVAGMAKQRGVTRAAISMEKAGGLEEPVIFVIGNAPTALIRLKELYEEGRMFPAAVIGVPVGFVNVEESKEMMIGTGIPCIVSRGRKGGSNIAAAICNAILYDI